MKKKLMIIVGVLAALTVTLYLANLNKTTEVKYDKITVEFSENFKVENFEGVDYIYIPVNTDLSKVSVIVKKDGKLIDGLAIHDFILSIDTFQPGEYNYDTEIENQEVLINIIVK